MYKNTDKAMTFSNKHSIGATFFLLLSVLFFSSTTQARDLTFTWNPNVKQVDGYRLYYKSGANGGAPYEGTGAIEGNSPVNTGNVTTFTLHGLSDTQTYFFALTAVSGTYESNFSTEITVPPLSQPPSGNISVTFSWLPNQESNLVGYKIHYGTASGQYNTTIDVGNPAPTNGRIQALIENLSDGTTYYIVATAYDAQNQESGFSDEVVWTANPSVATDLTVKISWLPNTESTLAGYKLHYGTSSHNYSNIIDIGNPTPINGRIPTQVNNLTEGTTYYFAATAYDTNGIESDFSTEFVWTGSSTTSGSPPTAEDSSLTTLENQAVSGTVTAHNQTGLPIHYILQQNVSRGSLALNTETGTFTYTPLNNISGLDTFTFKASDDNGDSNTATVAIAIQAVNQAPSVENIAITTDEDTSLSGQLQAQDPDGDTMTYLVINNPNHGTLNLTTSGAFTYSPANDFHGNDSFSYQVNDGQLNSNTASVAITVSPVNDVPVAKAVSLSTDEDTTVNSQLQAYDPDGDPLTYTVVSNPANGTLVLSTNGTFTYTPTSNVSGTDSFSFRASDGQVNSNTAMATITIAQINDAPVAEAVSLSTEEDTAVNGQLQAYDPDGDPLTYTVVDNPAMGTLLLTDSGAFTYTPASDFNGTDSFSFKVSDGTLNSAPASVSISVQLVNDPPVAESVALSSSFGQPITATLEASDPDNDPLTYTLVSDPEQAVTITDPSTGKYTFSPIKDMESPYVFTYKVNDGSIDSNIASVTITLQYVNTNSIIFGDTPDSSYPGTLKETFTNLNNENYSDSETLNTWSWSTPSPHKPANTILIKADLSNLKKEYVITQAQLFLYQIDSYGGELYNNSIHKIIGKTPVVEQVTGLNAFNGEPWSPVENGTTYNNIPLGLADTEQAQTTVTLDTQTGYKTWDITTMVRDWQNDPATNFGLLLAGEPADTETGRTFASSKNNNADLRPKLVITFIRKPPTPSIISTKKIQ